MQDLEGNTESLETSSDRTAQLAIAKEHTRLFLKRAVAFICFGPGVLGFLWLMSRILRR